jgi:hypothetical protein
MSVICQARYFSYGFSCEDDRALIELDKNKDSFELQHLQKRKNFYNNVESIHNSYHIVLHNIVTCKISTL